MPLGKDEVKPWHWTTRVGDFFEEATARIAGGSRYATDSTCDYCPDVGISEGHFAESKASGRGGCVIFYAGRIERERKWMEGNEARLTYYIWRHRTYTREIDSEASLYSSLAKTTSEVVRVDLESVLRVLAEFAPKIINRGNSASWSLGWRLPLKRILSLATEAEPIPRLRVFGRDIRGLRVFEVTNNSLNPNDPF